MAGYVEKPVQQLIGDFYQAHAAGDAEGMKVPLGKLQNMIFTGELDSAPFIEYYNDMFSGRAAFNAMISVNDYPFESIFRELLQNTFDCYYATKDLKIMVNFKDNNEIALSYNEIGFTMEQFLYYLSFGRNSGDRTKEGRFGVGAKSVFMNVQWLSMRSNNFSFKIQNNNGTLRIMELDLLGTLFKGTEINVKVSPEQYARIKENFLTMTDKKGDFINLVELCFAFNRKKVMNIQEANIEEPDRTFNVAIMEKGKIVTLYKIAYFQKEDNPNVKMIRFMQNNKSVVDFICHEKDGFCYLIPFAVATAKRASIVKVFLQKYNFFSTYELTGLIKADAKEKIIDEKLSAFFVSVSNDYITSFRTGIKAESEHIVIQKVEEGVKNLIENYEEYFVLELQPLTGVDGRWQLRPKSYAFEFIKNFILTSKMAVNLKNNFQSSISLQFPNENKPVPYAELRETAFSVIKTGITDEAHKTGVAYEKFIRGQRDKTVDKLYKYEYKTIYLSYEWESQSGAAGRQFYYEFIRPSGSYIIENNKTNIPDYNLYVNFNSIVGLFLDKFMGKDNLVEDEDALESALSFFDESYNEDYKIHMRYYQLYISHMGEQHTIDISKMKIGNIRNAMEAIMTRRHRFDTAQAFNDTSKMILNVFTQGKETIQFLKEIKEQGGQVTLALDINKKYRFSAYGNQFLIPSKTTNAQMLEILGDMTMLIAAGMLNGRKYDFAYSRGRYSFDKTVVYNTLKSEKISVDSVGDALSRIYVSDLKLDRIALLGAEDKILEIIELSAAVPEKFRKETEKYVILKDDFGKPEFADIVETLITGENQGLLAKTFVKSVEPNIILPDQTPYYNRPLPSVSREEFDYLRSESRRLAEIKGQKSYKNFFAKDVNSKLFGYGTSCPICEVETETVNSFGVKDFEVEVIADGREKVFALSLYMCANDFYAASGWIIDDISIGGMPPFSWVEEITSAEVIAPEFLYCRLIMKTSISYDIPANDKFGARDSSTAFTPARGVDFVLTPLMAAKWVEDNVSAPVSEENPE